MKRFGNILRRPECIGDDRRALVRAVALTENQLLWARNPSIAFNPGASTPAPAAA